MSILVAKDIAEVIPIELLRMARIEQEASNEVIRKYRMVRMPYLTLERAMYLVLSRLVENHPKGKEILSYVTHTGDFLILRTIGLSK